AVLRTTYESVSLNPELVTTDVERFEGALAAARSADRALERARLLSEAVDLYRGELLPGHYEDWIPAEQHRLAGLAFQAFADLTGDLEQAGEWQRALDCAHRALALDPTREETHQAAMRLCLQTGQPSAAARQYREL